MTNELPKLWAHQKDAIDRALNKFALFFDPGCGKSRTALELYKQRHDKLQSKRVVIFAPLNVCRNWINEIEAYLEMPYKIYLVSGQTKEKKLRILNEFVSERIPANTHHFLICNIESLRGKAYLMVLKGAGCKFFIVDESHNFKGPNSLQTKGLMELFDWSKPEFIYLLTGTPAPQGEIDLWSTFKILGQTSLPFYIWRKKYFDDRNARRAGTQGYYPDYIVRESSKLEFKKLLTNCSISAKKDLVLDLPELLHLDLYAELSKEQRNHYDTMEEYLFAADETGNELNASNILVRTLRLQQIVAGFLGDTPIQENPRLSVLGDAIALTNGGPDEAPAQFVIWTIFRPSYAILGKYLESLGISYVTLTGDVSAEDRFENIRKFQAGEVRAIIAHPKAGGVGVNLTAASYSIHYSRSFSLTDDLQSEARNYRGGSERHKRITRIDIIAEDTIDEDISAALKNKKTVQDFILGLKQKRGQNAKHRKHRGGAL